MKPFTFTLDTGDRNAGEVHLPPAGGRLPVMIYCHGWSGDRILGPSAQAVLKRSQESRAFVAFDFFGRGETGGDFSAMTYGRWTANLSDVVDWIGRQDWADPARIGCLAYSSGSTPALRLAAMGRKLAFVISIATCLGLFINMPNGPGKTLVDNWDALSSGSTADVFGTPFKLDFFKDFLGRAPVYGLKDVSCPVFFLQGKLDNPFRRADARLGFEVMKRVGLPAWHLELERGGHMLDEVPQECVDRVFSWLREIGIVG